MTVLNITANFAPLAKRAGFAGTPLEGLGGNRYGCAGSGNGLTGHGYWIACCRLRHVEDNEKQPTAVEDGKDE